MVTIEQNKDLTDLHTFGVPWKSRFFVDIRDSVDLHAALDMVRDQSLKLFVLGGGSNILPTETFSGLVIHNGIMNRSVVAQDDTSITLDVGAGENWHDTVIWCTEHGYHGIENLALIPGTVGGAVVQNIGAYDVDISRYVVSVHTVDLQTGEERVFGHGDCDFGYRYSYFKSHTGDYCVTSVRIRLSLQFVPVLTYGVLKDYASINPHMTAEQLVTEIIRIRETKLPDWHTIGTAGSFFSNPRLDEKQLRTLSRKYPNMPVFDNYGTGKNTVPAGWLIEYSRLDRTVRDNFLYTKHALIVVNIYKGQSGMPIKYGKQVHHASKMIANRVEKDFGLRLEPEVLIL